MSMHRILGEKYQLIRPLNQGGMGSVWLAEHLSLAAPVAVKLIAADLGTSADFRQRFLREAHAAAALRSPHVVQTLDYGVDGDTPYIVMELLEGESLADRLGRKGKLTPRETELVLRHVSRAVARAHEQGIVHRDLKPANIFITRNEEEEFIKLFDFGIAKAMTDETDGTTAQTRTGSLLGTPAYMSPEQLEARKDCDLRVDIWAMGVIAFECLLGKQPFSGNGLGGLVQAVLSGPIPVPSQVGPVPAGFDAWFARACSRRAAERFPSARDAAHELRRVLAPELDSWDAEPPPTERAPGSPGSGAKEPVPHDELAFELQRRSPADTGAPASATIPRSRWHGGRVPVVPALGVALMVILAAGQRLLKQPDGSPDQTALPASLPLSLEDREEPGSSRTRAAGTARTGSASMDLPGDARAHRAAAPERAGDPTRGRAEVPRPAERPTAASSASSRAAESEAATLTITSTPISHVLLDGAPKGSTPLHSLRVQPGPHRVTLIYGKQRKTLYVETSAGENSLLSARFSEPEPLAAQEPASEP